MTTSDHSTEDPIGATSSATAETPPAAATAATSGTPVPTGTHEPSETAAVLDPTLAPPVLPTEPRPGSEYPHTLRTPAARWWRPLVGILVAVLLFVAASIACFVAALAADVAVFGRTVDPSSMRLTPALFVGTLVPLILLVPITWGITRWFHGQRFGWTGSVESRFRLGRLGAAIPVMLVLLLAYFTVFTLAFPTGTPGRGEHWLAFLVIGVLLLPAQAAAEEIFFRGYLMRAVASWFARPQLAFVVGTLVSAVLFAAAHGAADPWLNLYYLCFGITLSLLTRLTGGLEAAMLVHVANNVASAVVGSLLTDMSTAFDRSAGVGGPFMLVQIVAIALVAAALVWWTRRRDFATRVPEVHGVA
ncbi:CPBP family intramembrane glutamic endopeptidase [Mobilicoccus pelagius]|uniref:CAAX prenyl protease 2/Lysostaphin resistance protein A-like domain-containing protein n=1 Tax=Mobilicoccus pelagius NBRC 104925 TaxID=1089455 RepID=H5UQS8_9MICO|nr:type II CAAX endopeptidase family protein [Mobilicoccus pelagius]GAB48086.1 hypothetical protein MOPEL_060_00020 [Mobilicoccus pelagius NBRC 104925]